MSFSTQFFYVRYAVSYRDLEAIMEERGVKMDHSTLNRCVINYSSSLSLADKNIKLCDRTGILWGYLSVFCPL